MSKTHEINHQAEGKIGIAIRRLADRYPFHCKILERFKVQPRPSLDTMAVTVAGDEVLLLYNADFVLGIALPMLAGVLLHEVHHVLFGHVLADPANYPDVDARVIAEEVTVNEFITEALPAGAITLAQVPGLPLLESTGERYVRLAGKVKLPEMTPAISPELGNDQAGRLRAGSRRPSPGTQRAKGRHGDEEGTNVGAASQDSKSPVPPGEAKQQGKRDEAIPGKTVDDHAVWGEARQHPGRSAEAIRAVIEDAVLEAGPGGVPMELADAIAALGIGDISGAGEQHGSKGRSGSIDWRRQLRSYVGQMLQVRPVFNRPPRRFPELVGIVPGKRRRSDQPKIMAVLDTSGSITPDLLDIMNAELAKLAKCHEVIVVECDCKIRDVYKYRKLEAVKGRGGTDFRPVFEPDFLRKHRPDLVVFFTDGLGPAPESKPPVPVIWCLVPGGKRPVNCWGRIIRIDSQ